MPSGTAEEVDPSYAAVQRAQEVSTNRLATAASQDSTAQGLPKAVSDSSANWHEARPSGSQLLAEWHGQVIEVLDDVFVAQLKGKHGEAVAGREEEALIPIEEVMPSDRELLEPGAFFRLCVSYSVDGFGGHRRITDLVFRRLPAYRREELEQAQARGREIARGLRLE